MRKTNMRQLKIAAGVLAIASCFVTLILYYRHRSSFMIQRNRPFKHTTTEKYFMELPLGHKPLNEIYRDIRKNDDIDYTFDLEEMHPPQMLDTVGCKIPVAMINYRKYMKNNTKTKATCGRRAVFLTKVGKDKVQIQIKARTIRRYLRKSALFECCYRFILKATQVSTKPKKMLYTPWKKVGDKSVITLQSDFVNIRCSEINKMNISHPVYDDVYAFSRKLNITPTPTRKIKCKFQYNVLMIGMDSMSLSRAVQTMPQTIAFFHNNFWLSFRGYHKIDDNTFPNLMAAITGKNLTTITKQCSGKMGKCIDLMIWKTFKDNGYVTAYGEDYLRLPDTFRDNYAFQTPPTDHYMRPLFLKGETEYSNKTLVCAGKIPSGQQVLDYALDFADTYKKESFFGLFWINSFSHNANSRPQDGDKIMENFFNQLAYTGVLLNTFVIFFSDHGLRFGSLRLNMEGYYDDRLPMLFMWAPTFFKGRHPFEYRSLAINQFKLLTPYDLYNTLIDIQRISICGFTNGVASEGCPNCQSMFDTVHEHRTCKDVTIHDKWCSCHKLYPLPDQDTEGKKTVHVAVAYIKAMIKKIETRKCWACMNLTLKKIVRLHFYYDSKDKMSLYYVVAFTMTPGNVSYEATMFRRIDELNSTVVVGPVSVLSPYRGLGRCAYNHRDRLFCVCQEIQNCQV